MDSSDGSSTPGNPPGMRGNVDVWLAVEADKVCVEAARRTDLRAALSFS